MYKHTHVYECMYICSYKCTYVAFPKLKVLKKIRQDGRGKGSLLTRGRLTSGNDVEEAGLRHAAHAVLGPALERPVVLVGAGDEPHYAAALCNANKPGH